MSKQLYHRTGRLSSLILRRDRFRIHVWILSITALSLVTAKAFVGLYPTEESRQAVAETMVNPAMLAMVGQGYGLDNYTYGAMMAHQNLLYTGVAVAIMCILMVARHTRADEEEGRIEMIRSLPTGRLSNLSSTFTVLLGTNLLLSLVVGLGLYVLQIESMDLQGSLLYGAALGTIGVFFGVLTALFAQLSENSRGTIGFSFAALMISYLIRAIGDAGTEALSWFSPLGWVLGAEVYVNNYWWPIVLTLSVAILIAVYALYLNAVRDLGSGLLPSKPGRKHASIYLLSPLGLAFRLQRTGIISWAVGLIFLGLSYGSILGDIESFFEGVELIENMLSSTGGLSVAEVFVATLMSIIALISSIPVLMAVLKIKGEEGKNHTEHLLGRAVSRTRVLGSYYIISFVTGIVMLALAATGLWFAGNAVLEGGIEFSLLFSAAIIYLPAIWVMMGMAILIFGTAPKFTGFTWLYLIFSFIVVYMGNLLQFPEWLINLSPYGHIPQIPVDDMDFIKVIVMTVIAFIITIVGFIGYNKRDIGG